MLPPVTIKESRWKKNGPDSIFAGAHYLYNDQCSHDYIHACGLD